MCRVSYLHLVSQPTWHSRTSSWTLFLNVPQSILHAGFQSQTSEIHEIKNGGKPQFRTKIVVNDDNINVEVEGTPNVVGLFKDRSEDKCSMNSYDCDLVDLPVMILQQVRCPFAIMSGIYAYYRVLLLKVISKAL